MLMDDMHHASNAKSLSSLGFVPNALICRSCYADLRTCSIGESTYGTEAGGNCFCACLEQRTGAKASPEGNGKHWWQATVPQW